MLPPLINKLNLFADSTVWYECGVCQNGSYNSVTPDILLESRITNKLPAIYMGRHRFTVRNHKTVPCQKCGFWRYGP